MNTDTPPWWVTLAIFVARNAMSRLDGQNR